MELTKRGIAYYWIPIPDYQAPRLVQIDEFFNILEEHPDKTFYVHCAMGLGRSAILVMLYLMLNKNKSIEEAAKVIKQKRKYYLLTQIQKEKIDKYLLYINGEFPKV